MARSRSVVPCTIALMAMVGPWVLGEPAAAEDSLLPADPAVWINGSPLNEKVLEGKSAFLWFFEET